MWLYQTKLVQLEKEFQNAGNTIKTLQKDLAQNQGIFLAPGTRDNEKKDEDEGPDKEPVDPKITMAGIKLQLDLAVGMIRLLKEQAGFYLKLNENFDLIILVNDLVDEFSIRDREMTSEVLHSIDSRWKLGLAETGDG